MKIAYIIYDNLTALDLIGFYDPISRLSPMGFLDAHWEFCSLSKEIKDSFGLRFQADQIANDLSHYDAIFVPGGFGTRELMNDSHFIEWLSTADPVTYKLSVCTGSLLLGAAGFLQNRFATTHFDEYNTLAPYCQEVVKENLVEDGHVITAGAVASSLDLGLHMCEIWAGKEARKNISKRMHYPKVGI